MRSICWTLNNYVLQEDPNEPPASTLEFDCWDQITYNVYGREVGENGTPHLQGYTEFKTGVRFSAIKKLLPNAHIAPRYRKSTALQASRYCKKGIQSHDEWTRLGVEGPNYGVGAIVVEYGKISMPQGYRSDIATATQMIDEGARMRDVALANPETFVKYHKGLQAYQAITLPKRDQKPRVRVFHGSTGSGKTKAAFDIFRATGQPYYVWSPGQDKWFDGYEGETQVLFDEFRGQLPMGEMLGLLDRYEIRVPYKGGFVQFNGLDIIITSPCHPSEWYRTCGNDRIDQLLRRINEIVDFSPVPPDAVEGAAEDAVEGAVEGAFREPGVIDNIDEIAEYCDQQLQLQG